MCCYRETPKPRGNLPFGAYLGLPRRGANSVTPRNDI